VGTRLAGKRALIIGASSGIGRATAAALSTEGARVALAARRLERLKEMAGDTDLAISCDVRDPDQCEAAVARAVEVLGGLDALVYAAGMARPLLLEEAGVAEWDDAIKTNLVGAALVTRAALPHLKSAGGRAVYFSSIAAADQPPRAGMGLYVVTKAALDRMVDAWRSENRAVGFTRLSIGDTLSEFGDGWQPERLEKFVGLWAERDYLFGRMMDPAPVAEQVITALTTTETIPTLTITPRFQGV